MTTTSESKCAKALRALTALLILLTLPSCTLANHASPPSRVRSRHPSFELSAVAGVWEPINFSAPATERERRGKALPNEKLCVENGGYAYLDLDANRPGDDAEAASKCFMVDGQFLVFSDHFGEARMFRIESLSKGIMVLSEGNLTTTYHRLESVWRPDQAKVVPKRMIPISYYKKAYPSDALRAR